MKRFLLLGVALAGLAFPVAASAADTLLNASYDVARELFAAENEAFIKTHPGVTIDQSHGGTSKQARAIVEGLEADVVTFNQVTDIDFLVKNGFVAADWQTKFPNNASPFYSFPSFLVRAGNPKGIKDWGDLARDDVKILGQCALHLSRRRRLCEGSLRQRRCEDRRLHRQDLRQRTGVRHRWPRRHHHLRRARNR